MSNLKQGLKCGCGTSAVGIISAVLNAPHIPICKQCFRRDYVKIDGRFYLRKDVAESDHNGEICPKKNMHECFDFTTGLKFWTRSDRISVVGRGYICKKNYDAMVSDGRIVFIGENILLEDTVRDEVGFPIPKKLVNKCTFTCSICKNDFISRCRTLTDTCISCAINNNTARCCSCGDIIKSVELIKRLNSIGLDKYTGIVCDNCLFLSFPLHYKSTIKPAGIGRTIGVEVECEPTVKSQLDLALWGDKQHMITGSTDGSLRGKYPCEFISPILSESNYEEWLEELGNRLDAKVYIRCGLHIHIGTEEYGWYEMNNLMRYIKAYESFFFSIVSPSRGLSEILNGNNAGLPVILPQIPSFTSRESLLDWCYGRNRTWKKVGGNIHNSKRCNDRNIHYDGNLNRYQWANFHGHWFKGAIEIRIHQGTANVNKIKNWIEFWLNLIPHAVLPERQWKHPLLVVPKHLELYYLKRQQIFAEMAKHKPMFK